MSPLDPVAPPDSSGAGYGVDAGQSPRLRAALAPAPARDGDGDSYRRRFFALAGAAKFYRLRQRIEDHMYWRIEEGHFRQVWQSCESYHHHHHGSHTADGRPVHEFVLPPEDVFVRWWNSTRGLDGLPTPPPPPRRPPPPPPRTATSVSAREMVRRSERLRTARTVRAERPPSSRTRSKTHSAQRSARRVEKTRKRRDGEDARRNQR